MLRPMSEILMGRWDCDSCGQVGILGDQYSCSGCGAPRPEDVRFYLPEDAEVVTDGAAVAAARAGADWQCEYCDSWNAASEETCPRCGGGTIEEGPRQETRDHATRAAAAAAGAEPHWSERPLPSDGAEATRFASSAASAAAGAAPAAGTWLKRLLLALFLVPLSCCCLGGLLAMREGDRELTVVGHQWQRELEVEVRRTVAEEGWSLPAGAHDVREERRVHHHDKVQVGTETRTRTETYTEQDGYVTERYTERVQDGYDTERYTERVETGTRKVKAGVRDLGNGRFEQLYREEPVYEDVVRTRKVPRMKTVQRTRQKPRMVEKTREVAYEAPVYREDPVYRTLYLYQVERWVPATPLAEGGADLAPKWPQEPAGPDERVARRRETYRLVLEDEDGRAYVFELREPDWRRFQQGSKVKLSVLRQLGQESR